MNSSGVEVTSGEARSKEQLIWDYNVIQVLIKFKFKFKICLLCVCDIVNDMSISMGRSISVHSRSCNNIHDLPAEHTDIQIGLIAP